MAPCLWCGRAGSGGQAGQERVLRRVGNLDRRLLGLPVPKNYGDRGYDGGTKSWMDTFGEYMIDFDLDKAEEGDVAFRPF